MKKKYIVILGVLLLSGCGKKTYQDYAGEYYTEDDTEITLRADGSCRLKTWAIKDETGITKNVYQKMVVRQNQTVFWKR